MRISDWSSDVCSSDLDVKVIGNSLKDFSPAAGDHADAIQFWTTGSTVASKNIEISNNQITGKSGGQIQGIFITDQSGGKLPYSNMVVKNNTLIGTHWHGITLMYDSGTSVTGNIWVTIPGTTKIRKAN